MSTEPMTNLVDRLRKHAEVGSSNAAGHPRLVLNEAADEIERLERESKWQSKQIDEQVSEIQRLDRHCGAMAFLLYGNVKGAPEDPLKAEIERLQKALRGFLPAGHPAAQVEPRAQAGGALECTCKGKLDDDCPSCQALAKAMGIEPKAEAASSDSISEAKSTDSKELWLAGCGHKDPLAFFHVHMWRAIGDRCGPMVTHDCECGAAIYLPPAK